jgi:hypothetical protein
MVFGQYGGFVHLYLVNIAVLIFTHTLVKLYQTVFNHRRTKQHKAKVFQWFLRFNANHKKQAVLPTLCAKCAPERLIHGKADKGAAVVSLPRLQSKDVPRS